MIVASVLATQRREEREKLESLLAGLEARGWTKLVAAIRRALAGERDADVLCEDLDLQSSMIVETILRALSEATFRARSQHCSQSQAAAGLDRTNAKEHL